MKLPIEITAIAVAATILTTCTAPVSAEECWNYIGNVKVIPCSEGPYHINSDSDGPDVGTVVQPRSAKKLPKPTEPEGPEDDGVGGEYDGWDTPRGSADD